MAYQDDIPKGYTVSPNGTIKYPTNETIDKAEVKIEGFDLLPQVAIQLARFSIEDPVVQKDKELFELCKKSRKYISLMLDKAIANMSVNIGLPSSGTPVEFPCEKCGFKHSPFIDCPVKDI